MKPEPCRKKRFPKILKQYSDINKAQKNAYKYLGKTAKLCPSNNPVKKYSIYDPTKNKWINFGQIGYQDYTRHNNKSRRRNYLNRTAGMIGNWKSNKYSANNLSRNILW